MFNQVRLGQTPNEAAALAIIIGVLIPFVWLTLVKRIRSPARWAATGMLATVTAITLVAVSVRVPTFDDFISQWQRTGVGFVSWGGWSCGWLALAIVLYRYLREDKDA